MAHVWIFAQKDETQIFDWHLPHRASSVRYTFLSNFNQTLDNYIFLVCSMRVNHFKPASSPVGVRGASDEKCRPERWVLVYDFNSSTLTEPHTCRAADERVSRPLITTTDIISSQRLNVGWTANSFAHLFTWDYVNCRKGTYWLNTFQFHEHFARRRNVFKWSYHLLKQKQITSPCQTF